MEILELHVWNICQRYFGPATPTMWNLAKTWRELKRLGEAKDMQCDTLALAVADFGADHLDTLPGHGSYAKTIVYLGFIDEELQIQEEVLQQTHGTLSDQHPNT